MSQSSPFLKLTMLGGREFYVDVTWIAAFGVDSARVTWVLCKGDDESRLIEGSPETLLKQIETLTSETRTRYMRDLKSQLNGIDVNTREFR